METNFYRPVFGLLLTSVAIAGCDSSAANSPSGEPPVAAAEPRTAETPPSSISVESVVFARELDDEWQPVGGPVTEFRADEHQVFARVTIDGRPREGVVTMRWMWHDLPIARADVNLADVNGGVLFSVGEDTFLRGQLTSPQLYIGAGHRLVLVHGEAELGSYPFRVVPPAGARPSQFVTGGLHASDPRAGDPGEPANSFSSEQTIYAAARAALGHGSWLEARYTINGQVNHALTREIIGQAGGGDEGVYVLEAPAPEGGWPPGNHRVTLTLDDQVAANYDFSVAAP